MGNVHLANHSNGSAEEGMGDAFVANRKVNRPGYEAAAVKGPQRQMNYPNSEKGAKKGLKGLQCFRCGSKDPFPRDCNFSWPKATDSPDTKGDGKKPGKSTGEGNLYLTSEWAEDARLPEDGDMLCNANASPHGCEENWVEANTDATESQTKTLGVEEEAFMAQWRGEEVVMLIDDTPTCEEMPLNRPIPTALIDSGASAGVVGRKWLDSRAYHRAAMIPKCVSTSAETFRFGDGNAYPPAGSLLIQAEIKTITGHCAPFVFRTDVVECEVPLLISRRALVAMAAIMDFPKK